jgi:hypothetical protein
MLELDRDQLRAAAWELGHTISWVRAALRERLDGFVVDRKIRALCAGNRDAPIWYDEITPPPHVIAQDVLTVLLDERCTLSAVERAAAARVMGQALQHTLAQVSAAVDHCARLDERIEAGSSMLHVPLDRKVRLEAYRPRPPVSQQNLIPRVTNTGFVSLVPVEMFASAIESTSAVFWPDRLLQEMNNLERWEPDWSAPGLDAVSSLQGIPPADVSVSRSASSLTFERQTADRVRKRSQEQVGRYQK